MNAAAAIDWHEANQRYLMARLAQVREALSRHSAQVADGAAPTLTGSGTNLNPLAEIEKMHAPSALDTLCSVFGLSAFEQDVLLMCAGMELDSSFPALCASAQGHSRAYPTFSLALAALAGAHWSALTPAAPLRHWRLIEAGAGETLTTSPLRIDERVLHYLTGVSYIDERLQGLVELLLPPSDLPASHRALAENIASLWARSEPEVLPVIHLAGNEHAGKHAVAAAACAELGLKLHVLQASSVPANATEREALQRLWEREAVLGLGALLVDCDDGENLRPALSLLDRIRGCVLVASAQPLRLRQRQVARIAVGKPSTHEQRQLWSQSLGPLAARLDGQLESLVSQFDLGQGEISAACAQTLIATGAGAQDEIAPALLEACCVNARVRLDDLAQRIDAAADWSDLVLPASQLQTLREIAAHVRHRTRVYETWGFASKGTRGLGISALFAGASGTGKTMAAEILARELRRDLYRIDLSQVVSKYIGETEKNLRRLFDAAEESGAVLLFDEADALFGKRSEVKDSHDRYANIEICYLLQRMETYRGLAILTTNIKSVLDSAFLRRIRFIVSFPFPDAALRAEIWRHVFPAATPTENLDVTKLARLSVAGGNIRNIAIQAAFLAADSGEPVRMTHLLRATRSEYAKFEKPLTEAEIGGWQ